MLGPSFSVYRAHGGGVSHFDVLGPIPGGSVLSRFVVHFHSTGVGNVTVGAALTASDDASAEALGSGRPLLVESSGRLWGTTVVAWAFGAERYDWFSWPVGIVVPTGSQYVVIGSNLSAAGAILAGVEVEVHKPVFRAEIVAPIPS